MTRRRGWYRRLVDRWDDWLAGLTWWQLILVGVVLIPPWVIGSFLMAAVLLDWLTRWWL